MKIIAITGGIGSGKSALCDILKEFGARVFNADDVAKTLMTDDPHVRAAIVDAFGSGAYNDDGTLNRKALASRIFSDNKARERMNEIVHPAVRREFRLFADRAREEGVDVVVREAALITGNEDEFDEVVVVEAPADVRTRRVGRRDNIDPEQVRSRMEAQPAPEAYRAVADRVISNDGDLKDLRDRARNLWKEWTGSTPDSDHA